MTNPPIKNFEGRYDCRTRVVIALENADSYHLVAGARSVETSAEAECTLTETTAEAVFPKLPTGRYEYDLTLYDQNRTVAAWLRGVLTVRFVTAPVPDSGEVEIGLQGVWDAGELQLQLTAGTPGRDGATPEIGANGNWWINGEDTGAPSSAPLDPVIVERIQEAAAGLDSNYVMHGWQITAQYTGRLMRLDLEARNNSPLSDPGPKWLRVWECVGEERHFLGGSSAAIDQVIGDTSTWTFDGVVVAEGQMLAITAHNAPGALFNNFAKLSCRSRVNTAGDGGAITGANGITLDTGWLPKYTATIGVTEGVSVDGVELARREDLLKHTADAGLHVSSQERESWNNKADLSALDQARALVSTGRLALGTFNADGVYSRAFSMFASSDSINMGGVNIKHHISISTPKNISIASGTGSLYRMDADLQFGNILAWDGSGVSLGNAGAGLKLLGSTITANGHVIATTDQVITTEKQLYLKEAEVMRLSHLVATPPRLKVTLTKNESLWTSEAPVDGMLIDVTLEPGEWGADGIRLDTLLERMFAVDCEGIEVKMLIYNNSGASMVYTSGPNVEIPLNHTIEGGGYQIVTAIYLGPAVFCVISPDLYH